MVIHQFLHVGVRIPGLGGSPPHRLQYVTERPVYERLVDFFHQVGIVAGYDKKFRPLLESISRRTAAGMATWPRLLTVTTSI